MRRKCYNCLCSTCLHICCNRKICNGNKQSCDNYCGFKQLSIFEQPPEPKYRAAPRASWKDYGLEDKQYRKKLKQIIQSGKYASLAHSAAHRANERIAGYLLLSVMKNLSYDTLRIKWELGELERIPYGRTDFYGFRREFISLFDKGVKEKEYQDSLEVI